MKSEAMYGTIKRTSLCAFKGFSYLLGALALTVAISPSVQAMVLPDPPALLNSNADSDSGTDVFPQLATDGAGNWVAVWYSNENLDGTAGTDFDIFVVTSANNGATWTDPAPLNTNADSDAGWDLSVQVTTDGVGNWVAVWDSTEDLDGTAGGDQDIFVATSANNGATWTDPARLNTNANSDTGLDGWPEVTTDGAGNWVAVWRSTENLDGTAGPDFDIFVATSANNGATWTDPATLNTNADSDSGSDGWPRLTTDGAGNWMAVWDSDEDLDGTADADRDIFVATSANNGATWTDPAVLNTNAASDSGADLFPQVATDGIGNWVAVWYSDEDLNSAADGDYDIFVARSINNGATWTDPALLNDVATSDSGDDIDPHVSTDNAGNWVVVWGSTEDLDGTADADQDIFAATSVDNGATWGDPALLNDNGNFDLGSDTNPQVATNNAGNWVAVWSSTENLDDTADGDWDVFSATFVLVEEPDDPPGTPAAEPFALALLALALALAGTWVAAKRETGAIT